MSSLLKKLLVPSLSFCGKKLARSITTSLPLNVTLDNCINEKSSKTIKRVFENLSLSGQLLKKKLPWSHPRRQLLLPGGTMKCLQTRTNTVLFICHKRTSLLSRALECGFRSVHIYVFCTNDQYFVFSPGRPADFNRIFGKYRQEEVNNFAGEMMRMFIYLFIYFLISYISFCDIKLNTAPSRNKIPRYFEELFVTSF